MKYIITTEDGEHFVAEDFTSEEVSALRDGLLTIIRLEDGKMLDVDGDWVSLLVYGDWN